MDNSKNEDGYEMVSHPKHYNKYTLEVIDILERIYGTAAVMLWCEMTAMKYRLRMGAKPGENIYRELEKEDWYLAKKEEFKKKLEGSHHEEGAEKVLEQLPLENSTATVEGTDISYVSE